MNKYTELCDNLVKALNMKWQPIAYKFARSSDDIPTDAFRPFRDKGIHYAMCQVVTMVKEQQITVALAKEDMWCWKPLICLGMVNCEPGTEAYEIALKNNGVLDREKSAENFNELPKLPMDSCYAIVIAPLGKATFEPDVICCYCDNNVQARWMIGGAKLNSGKRFDTTFDYIDSCVWSTIPTYQTGEFRITFPDPGEELRAACDKNEIIVSIPVDRFEDMVLGVCRKMAKQTQRFTNPDGSQRAQLNVPDFPRPQFYNELFKIWGLDCNGVVHWDEKDR